MIGLDVPGRRHIEAGLRELDQTCSGGPFSERAREALAAQADDVAALLALAERLAADVAGPGDGWVLTHGEPLLDALVREGGNEISHYRLVWTATNPHARRSMTTR